MPQNDVSPILRGTEAIASFLSMKQQQIPHLMRNHALPTFKIGRAVCANKTALLAWIAKYEKAGKDG